MNGLLHAFVNDRLVQAVLLLVAADFVVGVSAALKAGSFRFGWLHGFLETDVLAKLIPFFAVYAASKAGASNAWFEGLRDTVGAAVVAGLSASVLSSLSQLGFGSLPAVLGGSDKP